MWCGKCRLRQAGSGWGRMARWLLALQADTSSSLWEHWPWVWHAYRLTGQTLIYTEWVGKQTLFKKKRKTWESCMSDILQVVTGICFLSWSQKEQLQCSERQCGQAIWEEPYQRAESVFKNSLGDSAQQKPERWCRDSGNSLLKYVAEPRVMHAMFELLRRIEQAQELKADMAVQQTPSQKT
jgi:hypothetical protein